MAAQTVTDAYLMGIREGREMLNRFNPDPAEMIANLDATIKGFAASSEVGQMLRGERDFWRNRTVRTRQLANCLAHVQRGQ